MFRRRKLGVVFALILALITSLVVWNYTQRLQIQLRQASAAAKTTTVPVLVAVHDIPASTTITPSLVKVAQVPPNLRLSQALVNTSQANNKTVAYPITTGEQILPSQLVKPHPPEGLTANVPAGKRAISVNVNEVIGDAGLINPGNRVDVIASFSRQVMGKDEALLILQDIQVLAVDQAFKGASVQPTSTAGRPASASPIGGTLPGGTSAQPTSALAATATPVAVVTHPNAKTVTLAVTPEQAERLVLAEETGKIRLILRAPNDTSIAEIPEATLSTLRAPIQQPMAQITGVRISPTTARPGDRLKVEITVKNTSDKPLKTEGPAPGFTYVQGQTYYSQKFPSQDGAIRVGVNFDGQASAPFPYRWGLGSDLAPGASTTVVGYIKLTYDIKATNFWAGLIEEPANVLQNNEGTTLVTVLPANTAVVSVDVANVRSGPDISSSVIDKLQYGTEVPVLGQEKDWFKVKLPDGRLGFVAAGWIVSPGITAPPPKTAAKS